MNRCSGWVMVLFLIGFELVRQVRLYQQTSLAVGGLDFQQPTLTIRERMLTSLLSVAFVASLCGLVWSLGEEYTQDSTANFFIVIFTTCLYLAWRGLISALNVGASIETFSSNTESYPLLLTQYFMEE